MACNITFSRTRPAVVAIPEYGIEVAHAYWVSDQEFTVDGNPVRLIGQRFLQRQDEDDGIRPPRYAGNAYLVYFNCLAAGGTEGDCSYGACNREFCCEMKFEIDCWDDFQGNGTNCILPDCHEEGVCCDFGHASDCMDMELEPCLVNQGFFIPDVTCDDLPPPCDGACCFWMQNVGVGCVEGYGPFECRQLPGSPGAEDITHSLWRGPGSTCPAEDCNPDKEECCPGEGACCRQTSDDIWNCFIESPEDCVDDGSDNPPVFQGIGTTCATEGICGGACCQFDSTPQGGGGCFDVDDNTPDCIGLNRTFLGPGTSCANNAGDCGLCCLIDPATCAIYCDENMLQAECLEAGGTPFGPGASCHICDTVKRACCIPQHRRFPGGPFEPNDPDLDPDPDLNCGGTWRCVDVSNCIECANLGGVFRRDRDCSLHPCVSFAGACCCEPGSCPEPPCDPEQVGCYCYNTVQEDCPTSCTWHGPGLGCSPANNNPIPPTPWPVPEWCAWTCHDCTPDGE